jgi:hypothetical protein
VPVDRAWADCADMRAARKTESSTERLRLSGRMRRDVQGEAALKFEYGDLRPSLQGSVASFCHCSAMLGRNLLSNNRGLRDRASRWSRSIGRGKEMEGTSSC